MTLIQRPGGGGKKRVRAEKFLPEMTGFGDAVAVGCEVIGVSAGGK